MGDVNLKPLDSNRSLTATALSVNAPFTLACFNCDSFKDSSGLTNSMMEIKSSFPWVIIWVKDGFSQKLIRQQLFSHTAPVFSLPGGLYSYPISCLSLY